MLFTSILPFHLNEMTCKYCEHKNYDFIINLNQYIFTASSRYRSNKFPENVGNKINKLRLEQLSY